MSRYFRPILPPLPVTLSHTSRDQGPPPESTSHISDPQIFCRPSTKSRIKAPCTNSISIVRGGFCPGGFCQGVCCLEGFVRVGFCRSVPPSVTIGLHLLQQKVKHHFKCRFICIIKICISVTSHALDTLPCH